MQVIRPANVTPRPFPRRTPSFIKNAANVAAEEAKKSLNFQPYSISVSYGKITSLKPKVSLSTLCPSQTFFSHYRPLSSLQ